MILLQFPEGGWTWIHLHWIGKGAGFRLRTDCTPIGPPTFPRNFSGSEKMPTLELRIRKHLGTYPNPARLPS